MQKANESKNHNVEQQVDSLEKKYGEFADTYAETRAEAARLAGLADAAEHWREVEEELRQGDDSNDEANDTDPL